MNNNIDLDEYIRWLPMLGTPEITEAHLPANFVERLKRVKGIYDYWLQFPQKSSNEIVQFIEQMYRIKRTQAYQDIRLVKLLLGECETSTKQFYRLRINQMIERSYNAAMRANDFRSAAALTKVAVLNNQTDKPDPLEMDFDKIQPERFFMSDNISIIMPGKKNTSRKKIEDMLKKYGKTDNMQVNDADFEEITNDDGKK